MKRGLNLRPVFYTADSKLFSKLLELGQRAYLDDSARRLGLEHGFFAGKGIDTFAGLYGWFALGNDLEESRHHELAATTFFDMALDQDCQFVENGGNLFFGQVGIFGDLGE